MGFPERKANVLQSRSALAASWMPIAIIGFAVIVVVVSFFWVFGRARFAAPPKMVGDDLRPYQIVVAGPTLLLSA